MIRPAIAADKSNIIYPESDGKPMADNSRQFRWITMLYDNLAALFQTRADVFVCGNQNWYPVEGEPTIVAAPDVYVVFGRPKGDRGSYKQWEEADIPMTVVFEVLSPNNTHWEMADKYTFYSDFGAEEYYLYDPDKNTLAIHLRAGTALRRIWKVDGYVSPRLGIRFEVTSPEMTVYLPDGRPFRSFEQVTGQLEQVSGQLEQVSGQLEQVSSQLEQERRQNKRFVDLTRRARTQTLTPEEQNEWTQLEQMLGQ